MPPADDDPLAVPDLSLNSGLEPIGRSECLSLLADEDVGRVVVVIDGEADIFPVNYVTDDDGCIIFQTGSGTKLAGASGRPVIFEVDHLERQTRSGWSVVVRGDAALVPASESALLRARIAAQGAQPWPRSDKPYLIRLVPAAVTGRRIGGDGSGPGASPSR